MQNERGEMDVRWKQRFQNYQKAGVTFYQLDQVC